MAISGKWHTFFYEFSASVWHIVIAAKWLTNEKKTSGKGFTQTYSNFFNNLRYFLLHYWQLTNTLLFEVSCLWVNLNNTIVDEHLNTILLSGSSAAMIKFRIVELNSEERATTASSLATKIKWFFSNLYAICIYSLCSLVVWSRGIGHANT